MGKARKDKTPASGAADRRRRGAGIHEHPKRQEDDAFEPPQRTSPGWKELATRLYDVLVPHTTMAYVLPSGVIRHSPWTNVQTKSWRSDGAKNSLNRCQITGGTANPGYRYTSFAKLTPTPDFKQRRTSSRAMSAMGPGCVKTRMPRPSAQ